jgi:hypothetical protein
LVLPRVKASQRQQTRLYTGPRQTGDFLATLNGIDMTRLMVTDPAGVAEQQGLAATEPVH